VALIVKAAGAWGLRGFHCHQMNPKAQAPTSKLHQAPIPAHATGSFYVLRLVPVAKRQPRSSAFPASEGFVTNGTIGCAVRFLSFSNPVDIESDFLFNPVHANRES
jgi:hypothetical protein